MPKIKFTGRKEVLEVPKGTNLRQAMMANKVPVYRGKFNEKANCDGKGMCGKCRVYVKEGDQNASPMGLWEKFRTSLAPFMIGHEDEARLSCQTTVEGDMTVEATPEFNWFGEELKYTTRPCE